MGGPATKTIKFADEQIAITPRQAEADTLVGEICRKRGVSEQTPLALEESLRR